MDRLWNRNYCKVMTANFTLFFAFYVLTPLLPLYLSEHFGATKDVIGLVLSGYTITALLFRPFSGYMVDSFPRKTVLMISFGLFAIFFAGYLAASTLLLFMIVRTLHGGPFGMLTVANSTAAIDVLPSSRRTEGIGYYGLSNNLAMALAPTIGIFIYQLTGSFEFLFWLALIVACCGWLVDATVELKERPVIQKSKLSWDRFFLVRGWLIGLNMIAFGFSFGVLSNYLAIYEGMVISLVGYFLFIGVGGWIGYYGSALLIGLGNGHMWPAFQNMTINVAQNSQRGTANSTILISWDIGMGLGILIGGVVAELLGYGAAFWTVVLVNAAGVACFFLATKAFFLKRNLNETVR